MTHDFFSMASSKAVEYSIAVAYLLLFIPFWRYSQGMATAAQPVRAAARRAVDDMVEWFHVARDVAFHPGHAWARLEESSFADLTRAFAREAYLDFRTLNNGQAASAVFEGWFLSDRCRHEDRNLIQHMLSDYRGYMFDSEAASRTVGADLIMALGSMPFGKNYLAPFVATILADPIFAEVRDRSNANFLWFIKFERSFREAEQDLQTMEPIPGHGVSSGKAIKTNLDGDTHEQASAVIPLPGMASRSAPQHTASARGDRLAGGGNIVSFPALSGKRQG